MDADVWMGEEGKEVCVMNRRLVLPALSVLALVSVVAACGGNGDEAARAEVDGDGSSSDSTAPKAFLVFDGLRYEFHSELTAGFETADFVEAGIATETNLRSGLTVFKMAGDDDAIYTRNFVYQRVSEEPGGAETGVLVETGGGEVVATSGSDDGEAGQGMGPVLRPGTDAGGDEDLPIEGGSPEDPAFEGHEGSGEIGDETVVDSAATVTWSRWLPAAGGASDVPAGDDSITGDRVVELAPIESVEINILESYPVQYSVHIVSGLPNSCAEFAGYDVQRGGDVVRISVTNTVPAPGDPIACAENYRTVDTFVNLGSEFTTGTTYTVDVNGVVTTFVAQ